MQMYVSYYTRELMNEGDTPPIGIVLCADKSDAVVKYTLPEDNHQIFASKYFTYLPTEEGLKRGFELRQRKFEIIYSMKNADYTELKKSEKFTPALYHEKDGIWEGGSTSQFSPVMTFKLWEKFSDSCLEVSESMEVNGKKTFGYDEPIIYKRV